MFHDLHLAIDQLVLENIEVSGRDDIGMIATDELRRLLLLSGMPLSLPPENLATAWESLQLQLPRRTTRREIGLRLAQALHRNLMHAQIQREVVEDWNLPASGLRPIPEVHNGPQSRSTDRAQPAPSPG